VKGGPADDRLTGTTNPEPLLALPNPPLEAPSPWTYHRLHEYRRLLGWLAKTWKAREPRSAHATTLTGATRRWNGQVEIGILVVDQDVQIALVNHRSAADQGRDRPIR
jgi:hypothetical protein